MNQSEWFSSDGPRHLFYRADGTAFTPGDVSSTGGIIRQKPDITAADGVSVTGVGGFGSPFYGTSAAAPHAGAIAALVKSAAPLISNGEMRAALTGSSVDIMSAGTDRNSGAGIVMAFEALRSLGIGGAANPELGAIVASDLPDGVSQETFSIMCAAILGAGMTAATELRHSAPHRVLLESEDATFVIQEVGRRALIVLVVPPERRLSELDSAVERFAQAASKDLG